MLFALAFLLALASARMSGDHAKTKDYITVCNNGENELILASAIDGFLSAHASSSITLGPCQKSYPSADVSRVCFPDGIVDNDDDACGEDYCVGLSIPCYNGPKLLAGVGECRFGTRTCVRKGKLSACTGAVYPKKEKCNYRDMDCNGKVDDGFETGTACTVRRGQCIANGVWQCSDNGERAVCSADSLPVPSSSSGCNKENEAWYTCAKSTTDIPYMSIMARNMERHRSELDAAESAAALASRHKTNSEVYNIELFLGEMDIWLEHNVPASHIITKMELRLKFGDRSSNADITPDACQRMKDGGFVRSALESAAAEAGISTASGALSSMKIRVEHYDARCANDFCADGVTLKTCSAERVFGGNCSQ